MPKNPEKRVIAEIGAKTSRFLLFLTLFSLEIGKNRRMFVCQTVKDSQFLRRIFHARVFFLRTMS